jgi:hypothetical protein
MIVKGVVHIVPVQAGGHTHTKVLPLLKQDPPFIHGYEAHRNIPNEK